MTDTLSEVLAVTRLKGTVYFSAELRAPWGVALPQRPRAPFYVVTRGRCEITLDGGASPGVCLESGDLVVLPAGSAHALVSSSRASAIPLEQFVARHPMDERGQLKALNGKGPTTSLIGGFFELERARAARHGLAADDPPARRRPGGVGVARSDPSIDRR
jgi:mannose-6-phosphate isomerase-like protein (cupin superfamily)